MIMKNKKTAVGGVSRSALNRDDVIPVLFSDEPFNDASFQLDRIDNLIRNEELSDLFVIMKRNDGSIQYLWRGKNPLTTLLGIIEYVKMLIHRDYM